MRYLRPLLLSALVSCCALQAAPEDAAIERRLRSHVAFLADDLIEGRAAGTRGHQIAMLYVQAHFQRLGLDPAGPQGYQQPVALREARVKIEAGQLTLRHAAGDVALAPVNDMIVRPAPGTAQAEVTAPAVFVGFGVHAPEFGYDDFAQAPDVRGKIAVVLAGSPKSLPATARAHYSREKSDELVRRGAIGLIALETPEEEKRTPWAFVLNRARFPAMRLVNPDGTLLDGHPELRVTGNVSRAAATAFFKHAPKAAEAVFAAAEKSEPQAFPLHVDLALAAQAELGAVTSANVLAWLPGSDPALASEPLVITAHLDHLGIGPAIDGDTIYNGAMDNAFGMAIMLSVAEDLAQGPRPRRPVLFAALTAEEKGLLGAWHLARHPPARVRRYAANLNLDMPVVLGPVRDLIGYGADHSSLADPLKAAALRQGFSVSPDTQPDEVLFVRSDQYPFIRAGVPALFLKSGTKSLDPALDLAKLEKEYRRDRYHKPSDDHTVAIHWESGAAFARVSADLARTIADDPKLPAWNPGDFFGTRFGGDR